MQTKGQGPICGLDSDAIKCFSVCELEHEINLHLLANIFIKLKLEIVEVHRCCSHGPSKHAQHCRINEHLLVKLVWEI